MAQQQVVMVEETMSFWSNTSPLQAWLKHVTIYCQEKEEGPVFCQPSRHLDLLHLWTHHHTIPLLCLLDNSHNSYKLLEVIGSLLERLMARSSWMTVLFWMNSAPMVQFLFRSARTEKKCFKFTAALIYTFDWLLLHSNHIQG